MELLAESAVRITALAAGVALVLRALRVRLPRLVHHAWTAVTVVMLLLPVFVAWGPELAVPLLPSHAASGIRVPAGAAVTPARPDGIRVTSATDADDSHSRIDWAAGASTVYLSGIAVFLVRLAAGLRLARAIRRAATPVHGRLTHPACVTPMTIGIISPVVILPPDWTTWNAADLSAVLAHEEEHARRRDPLVAGVALLNRAIFWFHPLAWWLQRKIACLSEQACDAVVISRGYDADAYSACLLRFARRAAGAGGRIAPMATAIPGAGLRERLGMLDQRPACLSRVRVACASVAGMAVVVVCAVAQPAAAPVQNVPSQIRSQAVWPVETSEHFEIAHDNLSASRVSDAIRDLEAAYAQLSAALKYDMPRPIRVILVRRDRDSAADAGGPLSQSGAWAASSRVVISLESLDRRTGMAVHELTHQFALDIVPETSRVTPVLIEGLAEHQRGAWEPGDLRMTRAAAAAGAIPTVAALVNTDRHWAHAVFDFVAAQRGDEGVRRLLFALRAHETLAPAVPMAFGITLDQFEEEFRGYVTARFGRP